MFIFFFIIIALLFFGFAIYARPKGEPINFTDRKEITEASLRDLIIMVEKCPTFLIDKFRFELFYTKRIENKIISKAVYDKFENKFISRDYYLNLLEKCEEKDINNIPKSIDDYYFYKSIFLRGVHLSDRKEKLIFEVNENDSVRLVAEPNNVFDKDAIKVEWNETTIGYIPSESTFDFHKLLHSDYKAFVYDIQYSRYDRIECIISFYLKHE
ncbi:HIRAN domain-containing protein [Chryseobacterium aquaticum]|uniref:HIRAN domain-containing protein n=1 Tax=Chryseobacterium aquaticum subsp. greenlandense TaxID=345663 RepID=A0A101CFL9_9FLAO|nr:HIRAN domain-containing protein [Chryseobacterium aquaticum]KUJ55343.1 hypothetical protein AR686_13280 [Chryseobacterium aquaticum subsp. greenlandense]